MISFRRRKSILQKIAGPRAVSIAVLVARGEVASLHVQKSFDDFFRERLADFDRMIAVVTRAPVPEVFWANFYAIALDVKGSSALAGKSAVNSLCISLLRLLEERDVTDQRMVAIIKSHIDAMTHLVAAPKDANLTVLESELSRAINSLPLKSRDFWSGRG